MVDDRAGPIEYNCFAVYVFDTHFAHQCKPHDSPAVSPFASVASRLMIDQGPGRGAGEAGAGAGDIVRCWGVADDGAVVEVTVHCTIGDALVERWPPLGLVRSDHPAGPIAHRVTVDRVDGDGGPGRGCDRVESELALFASERLAGLVAVHAAVILRGSMALIVPGTSGAGKSTLCVAASAVGAVVLSDEYALVDPASGLVTGWRRPVRVRQPGGAVDRLDIATESGPVPVGLVALVTHTADPARPWVPISGAEAVLGLLANTVCARSRPDEALDAALVIARSTPAVAGPRGEAADAIVELLDLVDNVGP